MKRTTAPPGAHPEVAQTIDAAIAKLHLKPDIYGFKPEEAAQLLAVSKRQAYYLMQNGELGYVRHPSRTGNGPGGKRRIPRTAIVDYVTRLHAEAEARRTAGTA